MQSSLRFIALLSAAPLQLVALAGNATAQCEAWEDPTGLIGVLGTASLGDADASAGRIAFGNPAHERVDVVRRCGDAWLLEATIEPSPPLNLNFGASVQLENDLLVIGAPGVRPIDPAGQVHVYEFDGASWSLSQVLVASPSQVGDGFGRSISLDGSTLAIGSPTIGSASTGAAFIFEHTGGSWSQVGALFPLSPFLDDELGRSVAVRGSTLAIAQGHDTDLNGASLSIYEEVSGSWLLRQKIFQASSFFPSFGADSAFADDSTLFVSDASAN